MYSYGRSVKIFVCLFLMLTGTFCIKRNYKCVINVSTLNVQFDLILFIRNCYRKCKYQYLKNTFHYTDSKQTMLLSAMVLYDALAPH